LKKSGIDKVGPADEQFDLCMNNEKIAAFGRIIQNQQYGPTN